MNLYVWEGDGVLQDFTSGLICAIANSPEEALQAIQDECSYAWYDRDGKRNEAFPTKHPTRIIPLEMLDKPIAFVCWGGG